MQTLYGYFTDAGGKHIIAQVPVSEGTVWDVRKNDNMNLLITDNKIKQTACIWDILQALLL